MNKEDYIDLGEFALRQVNSLERRADAGEKDLFKSWVYWKCVYEDMIFISGNQVKKLN